MQLKRILAKDNRTAMDIAMARYGKDVLVVSSQSVAGQVELVVALDVAPAPAPAPAASSESSAFTQAFRRALGPMPEPEMQDEEPVQTAAEVLAARKIAAAHAALGAAPVAAAPLPQPAPAAASAPMAAPAAPAPAAAAAEDRGREVVDLVRREIAALRKEFALGRQVQAWQDGRAWPAGVRPVIDALQEAGMPAGLRALLSDGLQESQDADGALATMREVMEGALTGLPTATIGRGLHAVCGPSGAGKTLMVARLARVAALHLSPQRVAMISFNDARSGAWSQTRVLAAQAGVNCWRAADEATLRLLVEELRDRAVILIDTAGADPLAQAEMLRSAQVGIDTHLLLPADASIGSVKRLLAESEPWRSLMVGKVDECQSAWPLLQALCDQRVPVSCMAASGDVQVQARPFQARGLLDAAFSRLRSDLAPGGAEAVSGTLGVMPAARPAVHASTESLA
ncbi:MAG: Signal recognition particle 54 kDa protein [Pseudomonadota bacterium]|jgi:flagellar biosynthesis GTPase FlhF